MKVLVAAILLASAPAEAEPPPVPAYSITPLRYQIEPTSKIGSKKAGAICLPAGTIIWRDAMPDAKETAATVAEALEKAGEDVLVPGTDWLDDTPINTRYRLVGTVSDASLTVCSPNWGVVGSLLGSRRTLKARGSIRVMWRTYDATTNALIATKEIENPFAVQGEVSLVTAIKTGIAANARLLADSLGASDTAKH